MLAIEQGMVATARARANAGVGITDPAQVESAIAARETLTSDQRSMIRTVCQSPAGVVVVEGAAGVGKTFALEACREAFEQSGVSVLGCAVAGRAAGALEEDSAIRSRTVASTLHQLHLDSLPVGGVLVVDEAGMIGDRQLAELVSLAARDQAKLVVVGDPHQLQAIDAGAPMRTLGEHIGKVKVQENVRTRELWEREALARIRDGEARSALRQYLDHARVHTAPTVAARHAAVVEDYRQLTARNVDAVILAQRRDQVDAINELVRTALARDGRLTGPSLSVDGKQYQVGDYVICLANDWQNRITNGARGTVTAVDLDHTTVRLQRPDGRELSVNTRCYDAIDRGYALTVHKAQGMTADVALVVGSDAATREWAYTAMSRATVASHWYDVERPSDRDRLGVHHTTRTPGPSQERIAQSWNRSRQQDAALDYMQRDRTPEHQPKRSTSALFGTATDAQRALLADLGVELAKEATWIEASLEIDRAEGRTPGRQIRSWLQQLGISDETTGELIRSGALPSTRAAAKRELAERAATLTSAATPQPLATDDPHRPIEMDIGPPLAPSLSPF